MISVLSYKGKIYKKIEIENPSCTDCIFATTDKVCNNPAKTDTLLSLETFDFFSCYKKEGYSYTANSYYGNSFIFKDITIPHILGVYLND